MEEFIRRIPKAEVHIHLEGTISPETLLRIAAKNNVDVGMTLEELCSRRANYSCLEEFVHDFHICCHAIKDADDFYVVLLEYLKKAHEDGITYCEISVTSLATPTIPFGVQMTGLKRAAEEAHNLYGIKCGFLLIFVRNLSVEQNLKMIEEAAPFKDSIVGSGLGGAEVGYPASGLIEVFEEAKRQGLCGPDGGNISIHAGEEGDPAAIIDTLYAVRPRRIDHGVRSLESPDLIKFLSTHQIPLAVSPVSNQALKVLDSFFNGRHVVRDLLDNNLAVCINSDDPAFFGGGVVDNFLAISNTLSEQGDEDTKQKIVELCKNSFNAAFLPKQEREQLCRTVDEFLESNE